MRWWGIRFWGSFGRIGIRVMCCFLLQVRGPGSVALVFRVSGVEFFLGGWLDIFFSLILPWYLFSFYCHVPWTSRRQDSVSLVEC